jgi:hypothetical protein
VELPEGFDLLSHCREMGFAADRVDLVGSQPGFLEVDDAWRYLFAKGYGDIKPGGAKGSKLLAAGSPPGPAEWLGKPLRQRGNGNG